MSSRKGFVGVAATVGLRRIADERRRRRAAEAAERRRAAKSSGRVTPKRSRGQR